jgi:hypothetical protein
VERADGGQDRAVRPPPPLSTLLKTAERRAVERGVAMKALSSARVFSARLDVLPAV